MYMKAEILVPSEIVVKIGDTHTRLLVQNYDFDDWLKLCHELGVTEKTVTTKY